MHARLLDTSEQHSLEHTYLVNILNASLKTYSVSSTILLNSEATDSSKRLLPVPRDISYVVMLLTRQTTMKKVVIVMYWWVIFQALIGLGSPFFGLLFRIRIGDVDRLCSWQVYGGKEYPKNPEHPESDKYERNRKNISLLHNGENDPHKRQSQL